MRLVDPDQRVITGLKCITPRPGQIDFSEIHFVQNNIGVKAQRIIHVILTVLFITFFGGDPEDISSDVKMLSLWSLELGDSLQLS